MPASRKDNKNSRNIRRDQFSPLDDPETETLSGEAVNPAMLTEDQVKLRAMIPALTPAHGPESTATAILGALSLGNHRPNSHTRRKSDGHVNRPPNAFIVFRRAQVQNMPANVTQHQQRISNLTALFWRVLTLSEQNTWYALADDIKRLHNILFPDYNFNPRNPDGTKKPSLPRAGLTPERLQFAWDEAQLLIQKHTVMTEHPPAPPASSSGKVVRPKAPRKGQGTRAKERREREAAMRAAAAQAATAAESEDCEAVYAPEHQNLVTDHYFPPIKEEAEGTPMSEAAGWRPDFCLDGSVSSRSSPSNSWSELVGPLDTNDAIDPLDAAHCGNGFDAMGADAMFPPMIQDFDQLATQFAAVPAYTNGIPSENEFAAPVAPHYSNVDVAPTTFGTQGVDVMLKSTEMYASNGRYVPMPSGTSFYGNQGPLHSATVMGQNGQHGQSDLNQQSHHVEAEYVFHDIDPTATYLGMPAYGTVGAEHFGW